MLGSEGITLILYEDTLPASCRLYIQSASPQADGRQSSSRSAVLQMYQLLGILQTLGIYNDTMIAPTIPLWRRYCTSPLFFVRSW